MTIAILPPSEWLKFFESDGAIDRNDCRGVLWTLLYSDSTNVKAFRKLCAYFCDDVPDTIDEIREKAKSELMERWKKRGVLTDELIKMYLDPAAYDIDLQFQGV